MTRADEGEGREPGQIAYEAHPTNDTLELLGAFGRSCKIGKHQATNWEHLRITIHALDAAGQREEADTLLWQVWHRVNSAARHHEFYRIGLDEKYAAETRAVQAEAEVARLTAALAEAERERDAAVSVQEICAMSGGFYARHSENATNRAEAAEASASALRERVAALVDALEPLWQRARTPGADTVPDDGWVTVFMLDCRIADRAARTALEAPHADKPGGADAS